MCSLMILEKHLPAGSEGWKGAELEREAHFPGWGRSAPMRRHSTPAQEQVPAGEVGDAEEEFKLAQVELGASGASPGSSPDASNGPDSPDTVAGVTESMVTPPSTITGERRARRDAAGERAGERKEGRMISSACAD